MWVIAHRGFSGRHPENTLRSFRAAVELGVDMVECDVHASADGKLAVIHDATLDRTTNGKGPVLARTMQELQALDAGDGERIPTLEDLLAAVECPVVVEVKAPGALPPLLALYRRDPKLKDRVWPISFAHPLIKALTDQVPGLMAGVLYAGIPVQPWTLAEAAGAQILLPALETATREEVEIAHQHGLYYSVWTADTPEELRRAQEIGVDGIATNFPDRLIGGEANG
ncbi:MAG: glycerophosphodiester phosphodiesterase [Thermaerobacter sp.]|nr:glycerophosphodiester phosphodiesterase [Thermaerobacter sp.]